MNETTSKLWWRRALSLIGAGYFALMCWFSYLAVFYEYSISNKGMFCVALSGVSLAALAAMLYSRFQVLTRIAGILLLPAVLPIILLRFGEWELIIPIAVTALLIFFLCGAGETAKTVFGVLFLLLYVLGSLAYFMLISLFTPTTTQTILEQGVSPSNNYRYEIIQTDDSSGGNVAVHVEPNDRDIQLPLISFIAKGYDRTVFSQRPATTEDVHAEWSTVSRAEVTKQILAISENVELDLNDSQRDLLGVGAKDTVYLKDVTDAQLEALGVPEENDVLTFRGEICFRSYTAVLEDYFATENREISLF